MYPEYAPPPAAFTYSPSLTTSTPHSSWRSTTYWTAAGSSAATSAVTTGPCRSSASNAAGRGRFPPCVDRIRWVLCLMCVLPFPPLSSSRAPGELLDLVSGRLGRVDAVGLHPEGVGHLADVQVATGVDRDTVRSDEVARRCPAHGARAPPGHDVAVAVEDGDPARIVLAHEPVRERALALGPPQLRHLRVAVGVDGDVAGPLHVGPLGEIPPVGVEDLDSVVLPVADVHPVVGAYGDAVRQVELARADPDRAPGRDQLPLRGEHVDPAVAVAVRHVDAPGRVDREVGTAVEGLSRPQDGLDVVDDETASGGAAGVRRLPGMTQGQLRLPVRRELPDRVVAVVHGPHRVVRGHGQPVRPGEGIAAPGGDERAVRLVYQHVGVVAGQQVHPVAGIGVHRRDVTMGDPGRRFFPPRVDVVPEVVGQRRRHVSSHGYLSFRGRNLGRALPSPVSWNTTSTGRPTARSAASASTTLVITRGPSSSST